jgi:hypothetical protein
VEYSKEIQVNKVSYELYALINHTGVIAKGHYVAVCKHDATNKWFCYNDEEVKEIQIEQLENCSKVYMLFYRKKKHLNSEKSSNSEQASLSAENEMVHGKAERVQDEGEQIQTGPEKNNNNNKSAITIDSILELQKELNETKIQCTDIKVDKDTIQQDKKNEEKDEGNGMDVNMIQENEENGVDNKTGKEPK